MVREMNKTDLHENKGGKRRQVPENSAPDAVREEEEEVDA